MQVILQNPSRQRYSHPVPALLFASRIAADQAQKVPDFATETLPADHFLLLLPQSITFQVRSLKCSLQVQNFLRFVLYPCCCSRQPGMSYCFLAKSPPPLPCYLRKTFSPCDVFNRTLLCVASFVRFREHMSPAPNQTSLPFAEWLCHIVGRTGFDLFQIRPIPVGQLAFPLEMNPFVLLLPLCWYAHQNAVLLSVGFLPCGSHIPLDRSSRQARPGPQSDRL